MCILKPKGFNFRVQPACEMEQFWQIYFSTSVTACHLRIHLMKAFEKTLIPVLKVIFIKKISKLKNWNLNAEKFPDDFLKLLKLRDICVTLLFILIIRWLSLKHEELKWLKISFSLLKIFWIVSLFIKLHLYYLNRLQEKLRAIIYFMIYHFSLQII